MGPFWGERLIRCTMLKSTCVHKFCFNMLQTECRVVNWITASILQLYKKTNFQSLFSRNVHSKKRFLKIEKKVLIYASRNNFLRNKISTFSFNLKWEHTGLEMSCDLIFKPSCSHFQLNENADISFLRKLNLGAHIKIISILRKLFTVKQNLIK